MQTFVQAKLPASYRDARHAKQIKTRLMSGHKPTLAELSAIGRLILATPSAEMCLSGLFIHHWETMSLCDADETLAQTVSEIGDAILRKIRSELMTGCE